MKILFSRFKKQPLEVEDGPSGDGLHLLYDGAKTDHPDVDFVAVHGMGGHPIRSFTDAETGCCWLRDLLPVSQPHCRVSSYGYNADFRASSQASLSDEARELCQNLWNFDSENTTLRPRIFICHSLGGILVKRALIDARQSSQFQNVYKLTSGILFLGTPHRGSSSADLVSTLAKISGGRFGLNHELLRDLRSHSDQANDINRIFAHVVAERLQIGSFYETRPTKHVGIVTERSSAILGIQSEFCVSLDTIHSQLCKFKSLDDNNYRKVINLVNDIRNLAIQADNPPNRSSASLSASPFQESLLQWIPCIASKKGMTSTGLLEMAGSMERPQNYEDAEMDIVAVHGLGGSPVRSWINVSPQTVWLRDMLQVDVSTSRVMSYGYRIEDVLHRNKSGLENLAKDLVDIIIDARAGIQDTSVGTDRMYEMKQG